MVTKIFSNLEVDFLSLTHPKADSKISLDVEGKTNSSFPKYQCELSRSMITSKGTPDVYKNFQMVLRIERDRIKMKSEETLAAENAVPTFLVTYI